MSHSQVVESWLQIWVNDNPNGGSRLSTEPKSSNTRQIGSDVVYPNPTTSEATLQVQLKNRGVADVEFFDAKGGKSIANTTISFDIRNTPNTSESSFFENQRRRISDSDTTEGKYTTQKIIYNHGIE